MADNSLTLMVIQTMAPGERVELDCGVSVNIGDCGTCTTSMKDIFYPSVINGKQQHQITSEDLDKLIKAVG